MQSIATRRRGSERSIILAGERGSGKTAVLEAALEDLDCDVMWFRGDSFSGVEPWAALLNGLDVLGASDTYSPLLEGMTEAFAGVLNQSVGVAQLGRRIVDTLRRLPRGERPVVVAFENVHLCDPQSLELLAYLARRNHVFDVSYVITCDLHQLPAHFDGLPLVRLGGLDSDQVTAALEGWTGRSVSPAVCSLLADASDGNPAVVRELTAGLTVEQLIGDTALPLPLPVTPTMTQLVGPTLATATPAELQILACFAHGNAVPTVLIHRLSDPEVIADLQRRHLLVGGCRVSHLSQASLGCAALERLDPLQKTELFDRLSQAWAQLHPLISVLYRCRTGRLDDDVLCASQDALAELDPGTDVRLTEPLADVVATVAPDRQRARDWIALVGVRVQAGHLASAVAAFRRASHAGQRRDEDLVSLLRWRWFLSQLTGDPTLGLPASRELTRLAELKPTTAFEGLVLSARSALMTGATEQARRFLDQASQLSRAARLKDRALWRLVDGEWQNRTGQQIRPEALRELVTRWCDLTTRDSWYDDVLALRALIDADALDDARQFLLVMEAAYSESGGHAMLFLLHVRLEFALVSYCLPKAVATATRLRETAVGSVVHLHGLGADLIRVEALTGAAEGTFGHTEERHCLVDELRVTRERGYQQLVAGHYGDAAFLLESALRDDGTLTTVQRWELVADLVEARVALGHRQAAEQASRYAPVAIPSAPRASAAAARCRALLAPPIEARVAFAEALGRASDELPWIYRGRALLAYARRLGQLASVDEAELTRREAADLFRHHGLLGWQRHAEQLTFAQFDARQGAPRLHDRLDATETRIVRLMLSGRRNKQVATELYMSLRTLEKALTRIYRKLEVATKAEMQSALDSEELEGFVVRPETSAAEPESRPRPAPFPPPAPLPRAQVPDHELGS